MRIFIKLLTSSSVPLNINMAFTVKFLAAWVPSVYHFLKVYLSGLDLPCFHRSTYSSDQSCLNVRELVDKDSGEALLSMS